MLDSNPRVVGYFRQGKCSGEVGESEIYDTDQWIVWFASPNVVVAVSAKFTVTVPLPLPIEPVWIAMALRWGTVAAKVPPATLILIEAM